MSAIRHHLSPAEQFAIRTLYGVLDARTVARVVGLKLSTVHNYSHREGLGRGKRVFHGEAFATYVRKKHGLGWSDTEIAAAYGPRIGRVMNRHTVGVWRRKLELPSVLWSEHQRAKTRANTAEQIRKAGLTSIGQLRVEAFRKFARSHGWPEDLQVREVQILNCMWDRGPMTKRELVAALGMPWKGSKKSLLGNRVGGSYLATLMRRGMVVSLGRVVRHADCGKGGRAGQSRNTELYSLSPTIQRRKVDIDEREQRKPAGQQAAA